MTSLTMDYFNFTNTSSIECREVNSLNVSERCEFVKINPDCQSTIGYIDYTIHMYCMFGPEKAIPAVIISVLWLLMLFVGLGVTSNDFLCPSLFAISKSLRMSPNVAGVTLLAFGNGSPDIFSAIAGIQQGKTEMVIGGLIGGGIFVTTVVAGSIFLTQSFTVMKRPFLRDIFFYLGAAAWAFYLFYSGTIYIYHAIGFVCLYLIYIVVVVMSRFIHQKSQQKTSKDKESQESPELTFTGAKDLDNPEDVGVVLTSFFSYNDAMNDVMEPNPSPASQLYRNSVFVISIPGNVDVSDISVNNLVGLEKKLSCTSNVTMTEKPSVVPKSTNQYKEFATRLFLSNLQNWNKQIWWEKALEVCKFPIVFLLSLTVPVVDLKSPKQNWCRLLNCLHCVTGPVFVTLIAGRPFKMIGGKVPLIAIIAGAFTVIALVVYFTTSYQQPPQYHWFFAYLGFGVSVTWIYCIANEIVVLLQAVGTVFNLTDTILGLTILAWGNCLLDFLSNLAVAKKGFPRMGIAACFGAPFLTLLLGVGVPCMMQLMGELSGGPGMKLKYSSLITVLFCTLALSLVSSLVTMTILKFHVKRRYGFYLIALYVAFLVTSVVMESGVI